VQKNTARSRVWSVSSLASYRDTEGRLEVAGMMSALIFGEKEGADGVR
jgi:hypothetical protein